MKIYTRISWEMATGRLLESESYECSGPVAECKGDPQIKGAETSQTNFNATLSNIFSTQFGKQSDIFKMLTDKLTGLATNPQGFGAATLSALRAKVMDTNATLYQGALARALSGRSLTAP